MMLPSQITQILLRLFALSWFDSYPRLISQSLTFAAGLFVIFTAQSWAVKLAKK